MAKRRSTKLGRFWCLLLGVGIAYGIYWALVVCCIQEEKRGSFGDMFGALNTLFSGGALAGVVFAILLQQEELKLQRAELKLTREELKRTADAQVESEKALASQAKALRSTARYNAVALLPSIVCELRFSDNTTSLVISNVGNSPAFNVDIIAIATFETHDCSPQDLIRTYIRRSNSAFILDPQTPPTPTPDGTYGLFDRLVYALLPQRWRRIVRLPFHVGPSPIYLLVQYMAISGANYAQVLYFFPGDEQRSSAARYHLSSAKPAVPRRTVRLQFEFGPSAPPALTTSKRRTLPAFVTDEFSSVFAASVSCGSIEEREDRGDLEAM